MICSHCTRSKRRTFVFLKEKIFIGCCKSVAITTKKGQWCVNLTFDIENTLEKLVWHKLWLCGKKKVEDKKNKQIKIKLIWTTRYWWLKLLPFWGIMKLGHYMWKGGQLHLVQSSITRYVLLSTTLYKIQAHVNIICNEMAPSFKDYFIQYIFINMPLYTITITILYF